MPELPEIHSITEELKRKIVGRKISYIRSYVPRFVYGKTELIKGAKIISIWRRAKQIIITLDGEYSLLIHLKMTGQLIFIENNKKISKNKHTRAEIFFSDGSKILFNDIRRFGYLKIVPYLELTELLSKNYGPEPLSDLSLKKLSLILKSKPKSKIKNFLLDQKNIAGIGNIYADEILFMSRIKPTRRAETLKQNEIEAIYKNILGILKLAISYKGSSIVNYVLTDGKRGGYGDVRKVYKREGELCPRKRCAGVIKRIKIGSRSAYYCPVCQL